MFSVVVVCMNLFLVQVFSQEIFFFKSTNPSQKSNAPPLTCNRLHMFFQPLSPGARFPMLWLAPCFHVLGIGSFDCDFPRFSPVTGFPMFVTVSGCIFPALLTGPFILAPVISGMISKDCHRLHVLVPYHRFYVFSRALYPVVLCFSLFAGAVIGFVIILCLGFQ